MRDALADEVADWLVALRSDAGAGGVREEFIAWLRRSPLHVEEYLRAASTEQMLRTTAPVFGIDELLADVAAEGNVAPLHADRPVVAPMRNAPAGRRVRRPVALLAAAAALVAVLITWQSNQNAVIPSISYATGHGEHKSWTLTDGSSVELDTDSAIRVRYAAEERVVDVERGRAFFHVAKDPMRRFRAAAGDASVIALGTSFDVDRRRIATVVTLIEGRVTVCANDESVRHSGSGATLRSRELHAGEQATVDAGMVSVPVVTNLATAEAWRSGQIAFDRSTVARVAAEFNRYAPVTVEIDDAEVGARAISGSFDAHDLDSFLAYLQASEGVVVERRADRIIVHRRAADTAAHGSGHR